MGERQLRILTLNSSKPGDWLVHRARFLSIVHCYGLSDDRKKFELFQSLGDDAARVAGNVDFLQMTFAMYLANLDSRFVTKSGSQLAEAEFWKAKQLPDESILEWHVRILAMFLRAFPGAEADGEYGQFLRRVFAKGLSN